MSPQQSWGSSRSNHILKTAALIFAIGVFLYFSSIMFLDRILLLALAAHQGESALPIGHHQASNQTTPASTTVPQYFQTSPQMWAGPTATGRAPFLAQTNPVSFAPSVTFVPNTPLETAEPIIGQSQNESIFHLMANLSPYFSNPVGFGVAEYPLPQGANISQVQVC